MANETTCDRCGDVYNEYTDDRFWSGSWTEEAPDGTVAEHQTLCDDCHRDVVRS